MMSSDPKMGNSLCKGRKETVPPNDSKTPIGRVIDRCVDLFPPSLGKKKHIWDEKVLETSPPVQDQPKQTDDGWQSMGLAVPENNERPVAPPRKKRPSMLKKDGNEKPVANGLKEVFNKEFAAEENQKEAVNPNDSAASSSAEDTKDERDKSTLPKATTVTRKVSKVGNKKSDKFFGESLSDLSNEPDPTTDYNESSNKVTDETDESKQNVEHIESLEQEVKIISTFVQPPDDTDEFKKEVKNETAKLLFSLKAQCVKDDAEAYAGKEPIEEPPIIPKKRKVRHICDLEDQLCEHLHNPLIFVDPNAPKKPQRDFERYKRNSETSSGDDGVDTVDGCDAKTSTELIEKEQLQINENEDVRRNISTAKNEVAEFKATMSMIKDIINTAGHKDDTDAVKPKVKPIIVSKSEPQLSRSISVPDKSSEIDSKIRKISVPAKITNHQSDADLRKHLTSQPLLKPELPEKLRKKVKDLSVSDMNTAIKNRSPDSGNDDLSKSKLEKPIMVETSSSSQSDMDPLNPANSKTLEVSKDVDQKRVSFSLDNTDNIKNDKTSPNIAENSETYSEKAETETSEKKEPTCDCDKELILSEAFMKSKNIPTEEFLDFLEDELGDLLSSQWLIEKDKILEDFKKSMDEKGNSKPSVSSKETEISNKNEEIVVEEQHKNENHENRQRFKIKNFENMTPSEKRRHSIDDLESWFTSKKTIRGELPAKKKRRKRSRSEGPESTRGRSRSVDQPKEYEITKDPSVLVECDDDEKETATPITTTITTTANDHSPLLKFLDIKTVSN